MNLAVRKFVEIVAAAHKPKAVIEFGSKWPPGMEPMSDLRGFFKNAKYIGIDLVDGPGVTCVGDMCDPPFEHGTFDMAIACEVLEHCPSPQKAIAGAFHVLNLDGIMVVTVPFLHPLHHMPDYWRFTPQALEMVLRPFPWRSVYYHGDLALPHRVYGVGAKRAGPFGKVEHALNRRLIEMPAKAAGEKIYRWTNERDHALLRYQDMAREHELQQKFA